MKRKIIRATLVAAALVMFAAPGMSVASFIMPDFSDVPTGWTTDRYEPHSFANVGTYQGRSDVLGIEITAAEGAANRPGGQQGGFYNTQGRQHAITGGAGSILAADLFIDASWADAQIGNVRSDMWGVMSDGNNAVSGYPIIGFTNYGGAARYRYWAVVSGAWVDLATAVQYDSWTSFAIEFTGTSFDYFINGDLVASDSDINGSVAFSAVIMQAFNFYDPSLNPVNPIDYTAHWANAEVPEPSTLALLGVLLVGFGVARRRRK